MSLTEILQDGFGQEIEMTTHTTDLSNGWFFTKNEDGSAVIRNCDKGQRINLGAEEVRRLREIMNGALVAEAA